MYDDNIQLEKRIGAGGKKIHAKLDFLHQTNPFNIHCSRLVNFSQGCSLDDRDPWGGCSSIDPYSLSKNFMKKEGP